MDESTRRIVEELRAELSAAKKAAGTVREFEKRFAVLIGIAISAKNPEEAGRKLLEEYETMRAENERLRRIITLAKDRRSEGGWHLLALADDLAELKVDEQRGSSPRDTGRKVS